MMRTYAWLRLALYSSHQKYKKRRFWVMPKLSILKQIILRISSVHHVRVVKSMSQPHCWMSALHRDQPAGSETFNRTETFWSLPTGNGAETGRNTNELQECFVNVAKLLQSCHRTLSYCFVSVLSVQCGPSLSSINHAQNKPLMDTC